ncbi:LysR substrate-binding domain-containing protein [Erwinia tasmaniensis]|uniref:LysR-family transcriptional regulator n=1 Tax=Erwinia tasmaniensis (strain DSM 17950 / CFBP 7177 / CIP 109463 / NCPPB 4357 / Et1/99) TaxID=465817 RepID=B2VGI1_ERWT9|nr:LysR substrate-binding domain-containing protein [Erwinia tasmaniensis]CAO95484.1 LysR-family transcriptional regulator [Erwinia tasmaniensis Et1/99]
MKITLEELRAWVTVVDSGSITAAADQLNQTTSGISRALGRLESKLQTTLLHRTTRRIALSEEGQIFLQHARQIIRSVEAAEEQIARRREIPSGRLRVNAATPFMLHAIVPLIPEFSRRFPLIQLELTSDEVVIDLLEQQTDIAIRIGELRDSTLHARALGSSRLRLMASPDYLAEYGEPHNVAELLANHRLLGFCNLEQHNIWPLWHSEKELLHIKPTISASSGETLRQLAVNGMGIVRISDFLSRADLASGRLVPVLESQTHEMRHPIHAVYYRNSTLSARISCFLDYLSEQFASNTLL